MLNVLLAYPFVRMFLLRSRANSSSVPDRTIIVGTLIAPCLIAATVNFFVAAPYHVVSYLAFWIVPALVLGSLTDCTRTKATFEGFVVFLVVIVSGLVLGLAIAWTALWPEPASTLSI